MKKYVKNPIIADAFAKTESGKVLIIEAKKAARSRNIANHIREAKELLYSSWVKTAPKEDYSWRKAVYHEFKPRVRELAIQAALKKDEGFYQYFLTAVKFMDFKEAFEILNSVEVK